MLTSPGQSKRDYITLEEDYNTSSTSDLKRAPDFFTSNKTLEIPYLYKQISKSAIAACTRLSVDRAVDRPHPPVDRTGRPFPTESWVTSVGRPGYLLVHVVHVGRPGRSTDLLLVRAVDRVGRQHNLFCCCCAVLLLLLPSSFVDDFLDDPSMILVDFLDNILSLSNRECPRPHHLHQRPRLWCRRGSEDQ